MQYMGGKRRISKPIAEQINKYTRGVKPFVSLFCGSCAIESKVDAPLKILNDNHPYLIAMWRGVQKGYKLPDTITKEKYYEIKANLDNDPILSGFVGFGCSFGGKWFGGYASNKKGRNYASVSKRNLLKDAVLLEGAKFICEDYRNVKIPEDAVIYADPPYHGTTGYATGEFDSEAFWTYMSELSERHVVLVSEEKAPPTVFNGLGGICYKNARC